MNRGRAIVLLLLAGGAIAAPTMLWDGDNQDVQDGVETNATSTPVATETPTPTPESTDQSGENGESDDNDDEPVEQTPTPTETPEPNDGNLTAEPGIPDWIPFSGGGGSDDGDVPATQRGNMTGNSSVGA